MRRIAKTRSGLYAYLESTGVLKDGTDEQLKIARAVYIKEYKRAWRLAKADKIKRVTIQMPMNEWETLCRRAKTHRRPAARYIRDAAIAYTAKQYLVVDRFAMNEIKVQMIGTYDLLRKALESGSIPYQIGQIVLLLMTELERTVLIEINHPKRVEEGIAEAIIEDLKNKEKFIEFIKNLAD